MVDGRPGQGTLVAASPRFSESSSTRAPGGVAARAPHGGGRRAAARRGPREPREPRQPLRRAVLACARRARQVADYLVVLTRGAVKVAGAVDGLVSQHAVLIGPAAQAERLAAQLPVVQVLRSELQAQVMVRTYLERSGVPTGWEAHSVGLVELAMRISARPGASAFRVPAGSRHGHARELAAAPGCARRHPRSAVDPDGSSRS